MEKRNNERKPRRKGEWAEGCIGEREMYDQEKK
jgi:hypothetical protein